LIVAILAAGTILATPAWGQNTFEAGKKAYLAGQYEQARDRLEMASRQSPNDPEVFLWLGKAHYQLGELNGAMAAWRKTLALAPNEPYAAKMLTALRAEVDDVDVRIVLIEQMLAAKLHQAVRSEGTKLLAVKALTDAQRVRIMTLLCEGYLQSDGVEMVQWYAVQIRSKFASLAPEPRLTLLVGQANLRRTGPSVDAGLAMLKSIVAKHAKTPEAATAAYELAIFDLTHNAVTEPLAAWLAAHADHPLAGPAATRLAETFLAVATRKALPAPDAKLHPATVAALELLAKQYARPSTVPAARTVTDKILIHLDTVYATGGAYAAAAEGVGRLLAMSLLPDQQAAASLAAVRYRAEPMLRTLADQAKTGQLPPEMPEGLSEIVKQYQTLASDHPRTNAYQQLAALAESIAKLAALLPAPPEATPLPVPYSWAVEIATTVAKDSPDEKAKEMALATIDGVIGALFAIANGERTTAPDTKLHAADVTASGLIQQRYALSDADQAKALTEKVLKHAESRHAASGAETAVALVDRLLAGALPPGSRRAVLGASVQYRTAAALKTLADAAKVGKLPAGAIPASLASVVATCEAINKEFPAAPAWAELSALAESIAKLAALLPAPPEAKTLPAPYSWAVEIAMTVAKGSPDKTVATSALTTIDGVIAALFAIAEAQQIVTAEAKLHAADVTALALVRRLVPLRSPAEAKKLTDRVLSHLQTHYAAKGAYDAAAGAAEQLLAMKLPPRSARAATRALVGYKTEAVVGGLAERAPVRGLPVPMPPELTALLTRYDRLNASPVPADRLWPQTAALAERIRGLASLLPAPVRPSGAVGPNEWAVAIALRGVGPDTDAKAAAAAVKTITAVSDAYAKQKAPEGLRLAAAAVAPLVQALTGGKSPHRSAVLWKYADILARQAAWAFGENLRRGRAGQNAKLSDDQGRLLTVLADILARDPKQTEPIRKTLDSHLQLWIGHEHYAAAEAAYDRLIPALPAAAQRVWKLSLVKLWIQQVSRRHNRLLTAGLVVPRKLDPIHLKSLQRCYALQAGLEVGDPFGARVRALANDIIVQYEALEYFDVAAEAIGAKPEGVAAPVADAHAQLRLADLHRGEAERELAARLKRYGEAKKIALTDAYKAAIGEYTKFITDRPDSPLVSQAEGRILGIARVFAGHGAYDVAAGVYRDFADFAAKVEVLAHAAPGAASAVEGARFRAADALYAKAQRALAKQMAEPKAKASPPGTISPEFAAAVAAYVEFIKTHPDSALMGTAIGNVMAVAMEYAKVNAWDVAEGVYAGLLDQKLPLHRPERLRFAQGLCRLGKVMPDHARRVLSALGTGATGREGKGDGKRVGWKRGSGTEEGISAADPAPTEGDRRDAGAADKEPRLSTGSATGTPAPPGSTLKVKAGPAGRPRRPGTDPDIVAGDALAMAAIRRESQRQAIRIASLYDTTFKFTRAVPVKGLATQPTTMPAKGRPIPVPVLSEAEIARQAKALAGAYAIFSALRTDAADTPAADQARGEIMLMISHWRTLTRWERAAKLVRQYLADNPTDGEMPSLRLAAARDYLAWATHPIPTDSSTQERLAEVARRFAKAREALAALAKDLPDEKAIIHQGQWDIANSFLTQARAVDAFSPTLARGQYIRGARELRKIAEAYHDHPNIASVPKMLWDVAEQLAGRGYYDEAIIVWNDLYIHYPNYTQAPRRIAQTYQSNLKRPLLAAEAYLELNFTLGGRDVGVQNAILQIGTALKGEKRWVEALHVLEVFVDSFPRHASAGQALTMVGQIHQANEAWEDAIAAYGRVIMEFPAGTWIREARWAITDCTINLSRWREAMAACATYLRSYPKDPRTAEATRRIGILKDLTLFQTLVDEKGQRKAFDAQYQIAEMVLTKLGNRVKTIIEYRKVTANWPESHWADDAMFKVGTTYLQLGEIDKARTALLAVAQQYPTSPLADDALYRVGLSYQQEADQYATVTRSATLAKNKELAQKTAYGRYAGARRRQEDVNDMRIAQLKAAGEKQSAELEMARGAFQSGQYNFANVAGFAEQAQQEVVVLTANQLADRQDKINAALRKAVGIYQRAAMVPAADKAADSLLKMAGIYADRLKDPDEAMKTYKEIVRQFAGTAVAEDASWQLASYYEKQRNYAEAIKAYDAFLRNYRPSPKAPAAQFAIAENYEHLGEWVKAMDSYTNYINNYPSGPMVQKATQRREWIKTYRL